MKAMNALDKTNIWENLEHICQSEMSDQDKSLLELEAEELFAVNQSLPAILLLQKAGSVERIEQIAEKSLQSSDVYAALEAFYWLDNQPKLKQVAELIINQGHHPSLLGRTIARPTKAKLFKGFKDFYSQYGFEHAVLFDSGLHALLNTAYSIGPNYDLAIGNAKGGLFSAYIFNLFGLKTIICQTSRKQRGICFKWLDSFNAQEVQNSKIIVLDKDVITGRSLQRIVKELPNLELDLLLNWNPPISHLDRVPKVFKQIFYPNRFKCCGFIKMLDELDRRLGK